MSSAATLRRWAGRMVQRYYRPILGLTRVVAFLGAGRRRPAFDLVLVVPEAQRGWILEGIAIEIARYFRGRCVMHHSLRSLPPAKAYFFVHYSFLPLAYKFNPGLWNRRVYVWYTHPRDDLGVNLEEVRYLLGRCARVFCSCTLHEEYLADIGVPRARLLTVLGGADPGRFLPHARGAGSVGFSSAYYERKSPDTVLEIVRRMPHRRFLLVGRNWRSYPRFAELVAMPNFTYVEASYDEYPALYARMDVFVSASRLEGGPIPLIEAMMSNVVPVASRTGFAPDVIRHGDNGFVFDVDADPAQICRWIDAAAALTCDVCATVMHCTWERFARHIEESMGFDGAGPRSSQTAAHKQSVPEFQRGVARLLGHVDRARSSRFSPR